MASVAKSQSEAGRKSRASKSGSVSSKKASVSSKKASVASKKASVVSKKASVVSKKDSPSGKKDSVSGKKASVASKKGSVASKKGSVASKKGSVAGKRRSESGRKESVASKLGSSASKKSVTIQKVSISAKGKGDDGSGDEQGRKERTTRRDTSLSGSRKGTGRPRSKAPPLDDDSSQEGRSVAAEMLGDTVARASQSASQQPKEPPRPSRLNELERRKEARLAREARERRDRQLGPLGVMEKTEQEIYVRRQIHAIDAGAAMPFDMTNPAEAALAAIMSSVARGGRGSPIEAAMRAIMEAVMGVSDIRRPPQVREFMQHVLDKATGLLDVDPDSDVGKALSKLIDAVGAGKPEAIAAAQLSLKGALERALKARWLPMPTRMGDIAVGQLIASDALDMALMSVDEALLSGRARLILQEAREMHRRGEDIWTYMLRMQYESSRIDQRFLNIRKWKRMGGITQVPWTPTKRRGPIAAEYQSPGPACVALPNLIGGAACVPDSKRARAPAFSFGSRHGGKNDSPGPGPGQYNVTGLSAKGKDNPPAASLHSRPKDYKFAQTPAPGDYNPEKSEKMVHDNSPKYTFGLKTLHEKPSSTPAPNVYNIPTVLGATKEGNKKQAPAFTISGRQKDKPDDRVFNPGPGSYNNSKADNYKMRSPAYSISSRYQMPTDSTQKPGPGAHSPEKVYLNRRWVPNYSFGIKHTQYKGDKGFVLVTERPRPTYACTC